MEKYTIINTATGNHYDTNDCRFYSDSWEITLDTEKYLKMLIENNLEKFEGCKIVKN